MLGGAGIGSMGLDAAAAAAFHCGLENVRRADITYWTPLLHANRAIASMRQGDLDVEAAVLAARDTSLANRGRWFLPRIFEALGDPPGSGQE